MIIRGIYDKLHTQKAPSRIYNFSILNTHIPEYTGEPQTKRKEPVVQCKVLNDGMTINCVALITHDTTPQLTSFRVMDYILCLES